MFEVIGFDADDTLWHNEDLFNGTQERFKRLLAAYHSPEWIGERLYETELGNLRYFGYGVKSFTLSMIETAIELTEGRIKGEEVAQIMAWGKEMLEAPVRLLAGVEETVKTLAQSHRLMIVTKGDLFDQESKIARSGLVDYFAHIEIVSDKTPATYEGIFTRYEIEPRRFLMVGNSPKSDVLPVIEAGGEAVHIPYHTIWAHEEAEGDGGFEVLEGVGELVAWVARCEGGA